MQLVFLASPSLDTTRKIDRRQVEYCVLVTIDINLPPLLIYTHNATYYHVSDIWTVARSHWSYTYNSVDVVHYSSH